MAKILIGKVRNTKLEKTVAVVLERQFPHPKYRKLIRRTTRLLVDTGGQDVNDGDMVKITQVRPISKRKHFKIMEVLGQ